MDENRDHIRITPHDAQKDMESVEVKNVGETLDEQLKWLKGRPYTATRSVSHRGIYAKKGYVFLIVTYKRPIILSTNRKFSNARQFLIDQLDQGIMNHLYDKLWEYLKKKYPQHNLPE